MFQQFTLGKNICEKIQTCYYLVVTMDTCKNIKNTEYILENISMKGDASLISENLEGKG